MILIRTWIYNWLGISNIDEILASQSEYARTRINTLRDRIDELEAASQKIAQGPSEDEALMAELNRLEIQLRIKRVREQLNKDGGEAKVTRWTDVKKKTGTL